MSVYFSTNADWDESQLTKVQQQKIINGIRCLADFEGASVQISSVHLIKLK
jgi:hypothetical protein